MGDNPFQLDWDFAALHGAWPTGQDNAYLLNRLRDIPVDAVWAKVLEALPGE